MYQYSSGFADDIRAMIKYRKALGIYAYEHILLCFDRFCVRKFPDSRILTKDIVMEWIADERERHKNVRSCVIAIRQLGKDIISNGKEAYIIPNNFVSSNSGFVPHIMTDEELADFFKSVDAIENTKDSPYSSIVFPVLFRLLYCCGLRPNEGRELKCENVNLANGEIIIVHNKQKKQRLVVMSDDMLELCREYDKKREIICNGSEYFFPHHINGLFTAQQLFQTFKKCWRKANLDKGIEDYPNARPYDLRHRFASATIQLWLDEKRDLNAMLPYLRTYMGHKYFSSTVYYIHLLPENLRKTSGIDWSQFEELIPEVAE